MEVIFFITAIFTIGLATFVFRERSYWSSSVFVGLSLVFALPLFPSIWEIPDYVWVMAGLIYLVVGYALSRWYTSLMKDHKLGDAIGSHVLWPLIICSIILGTLEDIANDIYGIK